MLFFFNLKFKNPPYHSTDIALALHSAILELKRVIFSTTFFVQHKGSRYLTLLQMEWCIAFKG